MLTRSHFTEQNGGNSESGHYIELIGKTVVALEALAGMPDGLNLRELAAQAGLTKSNAHRILNSLKRHGYVEQTAPGGPYRLGLQLLVVARGARVAQHLTELARPYSRELVEAFEESTYLAVLREGRAIFLDVQETRRDLQLIGPLGAEVYFHATAAGKAIAAFAPPERQKAILAGLSNGVLAKGRLRNRKEVEKEWGKVRRLGHAVNDEDTIVGAIFFGAPLLDAAQSVCGSISIGLPKPRFSASLGQKIVARLTDTCRRLSETLSVVGYVHDKPW